MSISFLGYKIKLCSPNFRRHSPDLGDGLRGAGREVFGKERGSKRMLPHMASPHSLAQSGATENNRKGGSRYSRVLRIMPRALGWCRSVSMSTVWQTLQLRLAPSG